MEKYYKTNVMEVPINSLIYYKPKSKEERKMGSERLKKAGCPVLARLYLATPLHPRTSYGRM